MPAGNWAELEVTVLPGPNDASHASNNTTGECNNKTRSVWLGYLRGYEVRMPPGRGGCLAAVKPRSLAQPGLHSNLKLGKLPACPLLQGMGQATVQCISGCCCASTQLNGMAPPGVRITDMRMHIFKVSVLSWV